MRAVSKRPTGAWCCAGHREDRDAEAALAALCERYWYPLYVYVRRRVADVNEAQDLTQEFFAWLLEKNSPGQRPIPSGAGFAAFC